MYLYCVVFVFTSQLCVILAWKQWAVVRSRWVCASVYIDYIWMQSTTSAPIGKHKQKHKHSRTISQHNATVRFHVWYVSTVNFIHNQGMLCLFIKRCFFTIVMKSSSNEFAMSNTWYRCVTRTIAESQFIARVISYSRESFSVFSVHRRRHYWLLSWCVNIESSEKCE